MTLCLFAASAGAESPAADLAEHGHWKRLKALVEPRAAANPNDAEAQWLLSRARMAFRDFDGALAPAEKAAALDGRNVEYRWQVAQVVGELAGRASMFKATGLAKRYKREVDAALALNPKHTGAMTGLMEYYNRAPGIAGGDKNKAAELVDRIMAVNKVDGYLAKVRLLGQQTPVPTADIEQVFAQAVQADPSRFEPHLNLASIYGVGPSPRLDLAEKEALIVRKIDPDRVTAYAILAGVYAAQQRWTDLDAILAEAEKRIPDNLTPYLRASGALLKDARDLARAEQYTRKYLSQQPEPNASSHAVAHWRLGLILEKQGKKADAIAELQTATKLDPKFDQAQKDLKRLKT
ncbi:MAG TPA: tetratricopeptide repeat protein [Vicinamibacterales bacterium]|nr:tetratricopeptide repeat protein [Vicinamibacterales bacterium]